MHQNRWRLELRPWPHWGAYSVPPDSLAVMMPHIRFYLPIKTSYLLTYRLTYGLLRYDRINGNSYRRNNGDFAICFRDSAEQLCDKKYDTWIKQKHMYSALLGIQTTLKLWGMDHTTFNLQRTPCQPLPRKRSPDGAFTECGGGHLIAAHYSFIDPERMKGWVGLVGWPIADGLPT